MRRLAKIVGAFAIFGAVSAVAAPDVAPTQPAPPTAPNASPPVMSAGDMNVSVASIQAQIEEDALAVTRLQEVAKRQKDVIKLNCVNDRLVQVKAQTNIADATHAQLSVAIQKNSDERLGLYQQFTSSSSAVKDLREQAKACIGSTDLYKQESGVTVEHPPIIDDPTGMAGTDDPIEPPQYASPYD